MTETETDLFLKIARPLKVDIAKYSKLNDIRIRFEGKSLGYILTIKQNSFLLMIKQLILAKSVMNAKAFRHSVFEIRFYEYPNIVLKNTKDGSNSWYLERKNVS